MPTCRLATHRLADHLALACRLADLLPTCRLVTLLAYLPTCRLADLPTPFIAYFSHILAQTASYQSLVSVPPVHQSLVSVAPTYQSLVSVPPTHQSLASVRPA